MRTLYPRTPYVLGSDGWFSAERCRTWSCSSCRSPSSSCRRRRPAEKVEISVPTAALVDAARELHQRVALSGRYAVQPSRAFDGPRTGVWFPDFWLNWATGRNALNSYNFESSSAGEPLLEVKMFGRRPPDEEADRMVRYGVTHVLFVEPEAAPDLLASPRFHPVWSEGGMVLAEVLTAELRPSPVPVLSARPSWPGPSSLMIPSTWPSASRAAPRKPRRWPWPGRPSGTSPSTVFPASSIATARIS